MMSDGRARSTHEGPSPGQRQILHRALPDGSGHEYFVYRPAVGSRNRLVFVAVHDIGRDTMAQAHAFAGACEHYGVTLVAPHFPADRYPNYARLGKSRLPQDAGQRPDRALLAMLDDVATFTGTPTERVHLFGYGAGARFAMRFAMAHPERVAGVVMTAADAYTFPDPGTRFPRGIDPGRKRADLAFQPEDFLRVPMTVIDALASEERDARPRMQVVRSPESTARDKTRRWVAAMKAAAKERQLEPAASFREIEGDGGSFESFVANGNLPGHVFDVLMGPAPRLPALIPAQRALVLGGGAAGWIDFKDAAAEGPESLRGRLRRLALPAILAVAAVAIAVPLLMWTNYRATYVVSREGVVRSHIADVGARLDGVVARVEVDTGDHVRAGQVVARLESRHFEARLQQAQSQLEKARRELEVERLAIENERQRLRGSQREVSAGAAAARAEVAAARSRVEEAERQAELQKSLAAQGLVPAERARTADNELRTARALLAASTADASAAGAGEDLARVASQGLTVRERRVSVLQSDIAAYQAEVALAQANVDATVIRAPDDGAVVRRVVQPGGSVTVGQPVITLAVGSEVWVEAWIDEDDLADVAVGNEAVVTFKSYPDREFRGVVESLGVSTDLELPDTVVPQRRQDRMRNAPLIAARIRLDRTDAQLLPGLSAVVGIRKTGN